MSKKKPNSDPDSTYDNDREDFGASRPLQRKQVVDMIRRKESLVEADFRGSDLTAVVFDGVDLRNAKFAEANLARASFRGANLSGASFFGASLKDASLEDANLEEADFDYCWLDGVTFKGAKIRKAILPLKRIDLESVRESVRSGKKVQMEPFNLEEDE